MDTASNHYQDRRFAPRTDISSPVSYKYADQDQYKQAMLINISKTGALIAFNEEFEIDDHIFIKIKSLEEAEHPIEILVDTVRNGGSAAGYQHCYGCTILDMVDE